MIHCKVRRGTKKDPRTSPTIAVELASTTQSHRVIPAPISLSSRPNAGSIGPKLTYGQMTFGHSAARMASMDRAPDEICLTRLRPNAREQNLPGTPDERQQTRTDKAEPSNCS